MSYIPLSAIARSNGFPVTPQESVDQNCSPVRDRKVGPHLYASFEKKFGYLGSPICGLAKVVKLTGRTVWKNLRVCRILEGIGLGDSTDSPRPTQ